MNAQTLAEMPARAVSLDLETHLVQSGVPAPPIVCGSVAVWRDGRAVGQLLDKTQAAQSIVESLENPEIVLVGANIPYDLLCTAVECARQGRDILPLIFAAYDAGRVYDIQVAEALHAIACGHHGKNPDGSDMRTEEGKPTNRYSQYNVVRLVLGRDNAKVNARFRKSYALLEDIPIEQWPHEARVYPVDDTCNALEVALAQAGHIPRLAQHDWQGFGDVTACARCGARADSVPPPCQAVFQSYNLHDLSIQCYAAWAMYLGAAWGFTVDPARVRELEERVRESRSTEIVKFIAQGYYQLKPDGTPKLSPDTGKPVKDTAFIKQKIALAYGCDPFSQCETCAPFGGKGRIWEKFSKRVPTKPVGDGKVCPTCNGTGLDLSTAAVPRTDKDQVATGRDTLYESGDDELMSFADFAEDAKIETTYLPLLKTGIASDGSAIPINPRPNVLVASGRASYGDGIDGLPRSGGVRECFVARPGRVLMTVDWEGIELVAHAQNCLDIPQIGFSKLAETINAGGASAVHAHLAARMTGVAPDDFIRRYKSDKFLSAARQAAKALNFGLPGGMGEAKLVLQQRQQGPDTEHVNGPVDLGDGRRGYKGLRFCLLVGGADRCGATKLTEWKRKPISPTCAACLEVARGLKLKWLDQWPENKLYFEYVAELADKRGWIEQFVSKRIRGGLGFTDLANTLFQGRTADGMKRAIIRVSREMHLSRPGDPLYGARLIKPAHDEFLGDAPEEIAHESATRVSEIMVQTMREVCPDVRNGAPPALMRVWDKRAEPVVHGGRLVPWTADHPKDCGECRV